MLLETKVKLFLMKEEERKCQATYDTSTQYFKILIYITSCQCLNLFIFRMPVLQYWWQLHLKICNQQVFKYQEENRTLKHFKWQIRHLSRLKKGISSFSLAFPTLTLVSYFLLCFLYPLQFPLSCFQELPGFFFGIVFYA